MKRAIALLLLTLAHIGMLSSGLRVQTDTPKQENTSLFPSTQKRSTHTPTHDTEEAHTGQNDTHADTDTLKAFQQTDFYRTIVENNLFHPLGTRQKTRASQYRLLGTTTPPDGRIGGTAFIQHTEGDTQKLISVTLGDSLGDATVVDIQPKQVTLDAAGRQTPLKLQHPLWLKK